MGITKILLMWELLLVYRKLVAEIGKFWNGIINLFMILSFFMKGY